MGLFHAFWTMWMNASHGVRLVRIAWVLVRHDALPLCHRHRPLRRLVRVVRKRGLSDRPGERLALALQALGPAFIKLGQGLSTRADVVGEAMAADLADLRDRLPPFPSEEAVRIIEADLEAPLDSLYRSFERIPVAAASIAQVHFAVTAEGREVAVKVLRPGIAQAFRRDVALFYWLAEKLARFDAARRLKPVAVVRTLEESVKMELDLRFEAAAADEMHDNLRPGEGFSVPRVDWERTAERVFTMERVRGIPIHDVAALRAAGHDLDALSRIATRTFFNQVYRDGYFHADLHPGNLFVNDAGEIVAVDFGIMGRVDRKTRLYLVQMLSGFLDKDYMRVATLHIAAGYVPEHQSVERFAQACRSIAAPILDKPVNEISLAKLLAQLFKVSVDFEMEVQPQLLLLQKTMMLAEGIGRILKPDINIWEHSRPLVQEWARANLSPDARLRDAAADARDALRRIPKLVAQADALVQDTATNGLRLHPDTVTQWKGMSHGSGRGRIPAFFAGAMLAGLAAWWVSHQ